MSVMLEAAGILGINTQYADAVRLDSTAPIEALEANPNEAHPAAKSSSIR